MNVMKPRDSSTPAMPPASDSISDSVMHWPTMRPRAAPSDNRMANSRLRAAPWALRRPARLAQQAISSTAMTPLFRPRAALFHAAGISVGNSAAASASVRPGASRPIALRIVQSAARAALQKRYPTSSIIIGM